MLPGQQATPTVMMQLHHLLYVLWMIVFVGDLTNQILRQVTKHPHHTGVNVGEPPVRPDPSNKLILAGIHCCSRCPISEML